MSMQSQLERTRQNPEIVLQGIAAIKLLMPDVLSTVAHRNHPIDSYIQMVIARDREEVHNFLTAYGIHCYCEMRRSISTNVYYVPDSPQFKSQGNRSNQPSNASIT